MGWERTESSSHSTRCHGQDHLPLEQIVRESRLSFGMGWSGRLEGGKAGTMAGTVGSAIYNSQKHLRESLAPAANRNPRCRAIKDGRRRISASFSHGGQPGCFAAAIGEYPPPSVVSGALPPLGSAASAPCRHRVRWLRFSALRRLRRVARPCPPLPPQAGAGPG